MKKLFCLAVLSCVSFVGCGPTAPVETKPVVTAPADGTMPMGEPAKEAAPAVPAETTPAAEAPK